MKILIVFNLEVLQHKGSFRLKLLSLRRKEPLCCKSQEEKKKPVVNDRAGIKTL